MVPFERSFSKLSENQKIIEIGSTEFKLWGLFWRLKESPNHWLHRDTLLPLPVVLVCQMWCPSPCVGMISWRSELSTDAELSGGGVVDSTDGGINWITEPMSAYKKDQEPDSPNSTNWADFSSAFPNSTTTGQE